MEKSSTRASWKHEKYPFMISRSFVQGMILEDANLLDRDTELQIMTIHNHQIGPDQVIKWFKILKNLSRGSLLCFSGDCHLLHRCCWWFAQEYLDELADSFRICAFVCLYYCFLGRWFGSFSGGSNCGRLHGGFGCLCRSEFSWRQRMSTEYDLSFACLNLGRL